jgi:hypothetical protein
MIGKTSINLFGVRPCGTKNGYELRGKCYLNCSKHNNDTINNLEIDTDALKELGGNYIILSVYINNYEKLNLTYEKSFDDIDSFWEIHLYRVN